MRKPSVGTWMQIGLKSGKFGSRPLWPGSLVRTLGSPSSLPSELVTKGCTPADLDENDDATSVRSTNASTIARKSNHRRDLRRQAKSTTKPESLVQEQREMDTSKASFSGDGKGEAQGSSLSKELILEVVDICRPIVSNLLDQGLTPLHDAVVHCRQANAALEHQLAEMTPQKRHLKALVDDSRIGLKDLSA